ncbi:13567_t:CDS:2 [Cetraspora pellucida]|uniref:ATP-dependent DNA helicase n=1 Tax=Cetraspora pellucida TaxID=1433469 RepID=A0A9N9FYE1_9GLOM|nr:13567_t:CDS:2 [Cetraspora pellucida]
MNKRKYENSSNSSKKIKIKTKEIEDLETIEKTLSKEQKEIIDIVINQKKSLFFTGPGGCGKSYTLNFLIKKLYSVYEKHTIGVTASTALAALNIGGGTLHGFTGIGIMDKSFDDTITSIMDKTFIYNRLMGLKILIIDEISMINAETFDFIDEITRFIRSNDKPFVWNLIVEEYVYLKRMFRQQNEYFINGLNNLRLGKIDKDFLKYVKNLDREITYEDGCEPTKLFSTNKEVNICNMNKLNDIKGKTFMFKAQDWSVAQGNKSNNNYKRSHKDLIDWLDKSTLAEENLYLKIGADVLYLWNDKDDNRLVNGTEGKIVGFRSGKTVFREGVPDKVLSHSLIPIVKFKNIEEEVEVKQEIWQKKNNEGVLMVTRKQLPLKLKYGISIHKSQGMTIPMLEIDCKKVWQSEQIYVAFSRSVDPKNLRVKNFRAEKVKANEKVIKFMNEKFKNIF